MPRLSDCTDKTDEELVVLVLTDQNYYRFIIERYEAKLSRYLFRVTNFSGEEVEDLLQEIFIKAYRKLNSFNPKLKFGSWIYRIAHNEAISHFRKKKARPEAISVEESLDIFQFIAADTHLDQETDKSLLTEEINQVLNQLKPVYRDVLVLKYFEEKDYKEISDIIKRPMGTVATLLNRAKKSFKREYERSNRSLKLKSRQI